MIALMGGFFDPLTNGHMSMIARAIKVFPKVYIALAVNPAKKYTFSTDERVMMLTDCLKSLAPRPNDPASWSTFLTTRVFPVTIGVEYLAEFAKEKGVNVLLRGLRNVADYEYERAMAQVNTSLAPNLETMFMFPCPQTLEVVSSSFVKGMCGPKGWEKVVSAYVPPPVYYAMLNKFDGEYYCLGVGGKIGKGCGEKLTPNERRRVQRNFGGYCNKCEKQFADLMSTR